MALVGIVEEAVWVLGVGTLLLMSPSLPNPFGFAAAIAAIVLGPGHGFPDAIFRSPNLTFPERLLFAVLIGIAAVVTATYLLLKLGVRLDEWSVGLIVFSLTALSSAVRLLTGARQRPREWRRDLSTARWRRVAFGGGILLGLVFGALALRLVGL